MNGWAVLDRLKHDPAVRHIPVQLVSVTSDFHCALREGARGYIEKPSSAEVLDEMLRELQAFATSSTRSVLIVEDDENQLNSMIELIGDDHVKTAAARSAEEAITAYLDLSLFEAAFFLTAMRQTRFDCVVLDLGLPGMNGFEFVEYVRKDPKLKLVPIVVYTARDLTRDERSRLEKASEAIILKDATSPERLLEETALFLHRDESKLPPAKRELLEQARRNDPTLLGTRVLIVDDDVRNVFALTAALEQRFGMQVAYADNGEDGIRMLEQSDHTDVVLMDVMMPGMDGYETIRRMRKLSGNGNVPIIALTAKAMKGDRERCLAAGASDYIAKPVDTDQLASLIRVWVSGRSSMSHCEPERAPA